MNSYNGVIYKSLSLKYWLLFSLTLYIVWNLILIR